MEKGIIVVDKIPENCRYIKGDQEKGCPFGGMVCQILKKDVMKHVAEGTKPENCPIKPLSEKMDVDVCSAQSRYEAIGWNACINEILKGYKTNERNDNCE